MIDRVELLEKVLKKDKRLIDKNEKLIKSKIIELINKMDQKILELLLENEETQKMFFTNVNGVLVFDRNSFNYFIDNNSYLEDSYTKYRKDIFLMEDKYMSSISNCGDVVLSFPHKDCFLEMDSTKEDDERNEVFLNEVIMKNDIDVLKEPKVFVNVTKNSFQEEKNIDRFSYENNYLINGNNLLTMYSLLPRYKNRIKLMYWDILYNKKNDAVPYNDSFKHSSWLVSMKNRLEIAKKLLSEDGIICLQCDDLEMAYLKVLCDEIFGREKFLNCIVIKSSEASGRKMAHVEKKLPKIKDYLLVYRKNEVKLNSLEVRKEKWDTEYNTLLTGLNKDELCFIKNVVNNEKRNEQDCEKVQELLNKANYKSLKEIYKELNLTNKEEQIKYNYDNAYRIFQTASTSTTTTKKLNEIREKLDYNVFFHYVTPKNKMYIIKGDYDISQKKPRVQLLIAEDYLTYNPCDLWVDIKTTGLDNEGVVDLKNGKKPEQLIKRIIELFTNEQDIVLDAYLGSGTTAAVAMKLKRRFIGIEQLYDHYLKSRTRLNAVIGGEQSGVSKEVSWTGGGNYISMNLAEHSQKFVHLISNASDKDIDDIFQKLMDSPFVTYRVDINAIKKNKNKFDNYSLERKKQILRDIIDNNTLYTNFSSMEEEENSISATDKAFNYSFYKGEDI